MPHKIGHGYWRYCAGHRGWVSQTIASAHLSFLIIITVIIIMMMIIIIIIVIIIKIVIIIINQSLTVQGINRCSSPGIEDDRR